MQWEKDVARMTLWPRRMNEPKAREYARTDGGYILFMDLLKQG